MEADDVEAIRAALIAERRGLSSRKAGDRRLRGGVGKQAAKLYLFAQPATLIGAGLGGRDGGIARRHVEKAADEPRLLHRHGTGGDDVSRAQVERLCHRYYWAGTHRAGKDVLEVACGTGPGLGYLASKARSVQAGDITEALVARCNEHYGGRVPVSVMDAARLPQADRSLDVVILFEAIFIIRPTCRPSSASVGACSGRAGRC